MPWEDEEEMLARANGWSTADRRHRHRRPGRAMETGGADRGRVRLDQLQRPVTSARPTALEAERDRQEECFDELLSYTQIKNVNMRW